MMKHFSPIVQHGTPITPLAERLVEAVCQYIPAARSYHRPGTPYELLAWGRHFLPAYFRYPPSTMHLWLSDQLEHASSHRGSRINVLAPRGGAKSTVATLTHVLRCAVEGREPYIWVISATREQARTHLRSIRAELESNSALASVFPRATGRGPSWRAGSVLLGNGVAIEAFGMGQQLRGRRMRQHRPSLIVCDDVENDIHVASPAQRAACREWFHSVILKAGDEQTVVVNLATALHRESLAMSLSKSPGWTSATFRAIQRWPDAVDLWAQWEALHTNREAAGAIHAARHFYEERRASMHAGAQLLWPEKESLYDLMRMRADEGRAAFEREKQNSPIDYERCEWPGEYFDHHIWFETWPKNIVRKVMALDPSKGVDARHGDYSAYILLGVDPHGTIFVEADLKRRTLTSMIEEGVVLTRRFNPEALAVETNQYHTLLSDQFRHEFRKQRRRGVRVVPIQNTLNKQVRIRSIEPYLAQRRLRFCTRSTSTHLLVDQLRDFPLGDHDDGPDALEMAIALLEQVREDAPDDGLGERLISN